MRTLALLASHYPSLSHTFIRREIAALRELGVPLQACSIHRADPTALLAEADRAEAARTLALRPFALAQLLAAPRREAVRAPRSFLRQLAATRAPFYFAEGVLLADALRARDVCHVHAHFANAGGEVALVASRLLGTSFSLTLHGHSDLNVTAPPRLAALVGAARFVVCVSEAMRSAVAGRHPEVRSKLHVVRCGLDAEGLAAAPRAASPGTATRLRFLHVGRLAPEKNQMLLLDAFADARALGLEAELRIVGDGPERAALAARCMALGDAARLLGPLAGAALASEYAAADCFVMSSRMEGLPVVLMEAFAQGVPAIAPAVGGIAELVAPENGWLFPASDRRALTACLLGASRERASLSARGAAGRRLVLAQHDVAKNAAALRALIAPALAS